MPGLALLFAAAYATIAIVGASVLVWQIVRPRRKTYAVAVAQGLPTDPSELGLSAEEATFNLPDRHITPGWVIAGEQPDGPAVLVLHGHRDSIYGALRFANELARYAAHVVVFDWPGHGGCSAKWMTCGKREPADAAAVLDGLPDAVRGRPVVLFGYSLGAQIAIKTAAEHPRFAGVIADGPYRLWDSPVRRKLKRHRVPAFPFVQLAGLAFHLAGVIKRFDRAEHAKRIAVPLLVLHGSDDRVCPIEEGRAIAEAAPRGTFVRVEGGHHNRLYEQDPGVYHDALTAFFESLPNTTDHHAPC